MLGQMMDYQLTLTPMLDRARRLFPNKVVSTKTPGGMERMTYAQIAERAARLASSLERMGVKRGERVATFAWNNNRHLELYFAVPCMGAVLHPLNIRLSPDQVAFIAQHADDQVIFVDPTLLPLAEKFAPNLKNVRFYVIMGDKVPENTTLSPVYAYEDLVASGDPGFAWPQIQEGDAAAMCYTSGTTGNPRGVVYSHRAIFLHTMGLGMADNFGITERDVFMPVVPMFHVLAWGTPFVATMLGATVVFPGQFLTPPDLAALIEAEHVTLAAGIPTLWIGMTQVMDREPKDLSSLRAIIAGGAPVPKSLIETYEKKYGVTMVQGWGMTEMSPVGAMSHLKSYQVDLPPEQRYAYRAKTGRPVPGVEVRVVDEEGNELPWDGEAVGELQVRGPWIVGSYYNDERSADAFQGGWFRTGDVVNIDPEGFIQIVDRIKDLVKSGGEWISSVDLENAIMAYPKVLEASVVAIPHPKWQERPLACVVPKPEYKDSLTKDEIYAHLATMFPKWWMPDDIVFIEAVPKTSVGKFDKKVLRAEFGDYHAPEEATVEQ